MTRRELFERLISSPVAASLAAAATGDQLLGAVAKDGPPKESFSTYESKGIYWVESTKSTSDARWVFSYRGDEHGVPGVQWDEPPTGSAFTIM